MKFPTRYEPNPHGLDFGTFASEASLTKQEFKDECDINTIMRKYIATGIVPTNIKLGRYGDFSEVTDYRECLDTLAETKAQFMALPSTVRRRFDNDPAKLLAFVMDKGNLEEARALGLLREEAKPPQPPEPTK